MFNKKKNKSKKRNRNYRSVQGGTITSIAGGFSGARHGISVTKEDRKNSVLISPHSKVGKSRFQESNSKRKRKKCILCKQEKE